MKTQKYIPAIVIDHYRPEQHRLRNAWNLAFAGVAHFLAGMIVLSCAAAAVVVCLASQLILWLIPVWLFIRDVVWVWLTKSEVCSWCNRTTHRALIPIKTPSHGACRKCAAEWHRQLSDKSNEALRREIKAKLEKHFRSAPFHFHNYGAE